MAAYDDQNVFAKIIRGEIPCNKVYEDDHVLAFHDIAPQTPVHILVIPKKPLVNVAAAMRVVDDTIDDVRIACGGVQCTPRRMTGAEDVARGSAKDEETATLAGSVAARGAAPLNFNHFKIPLLENLVTRAIRDA